MLVYNIEFWALFLYGEKSKFVNPLYLISFIQMESGHTMVGKVGKFCEEELSTKRESCFHFFQIVLEKLLIH
jgi:hypothetical protein